MKLAVYGTLRVGDYNFNRFGSRLKEIKSNVKINGFKLYSLGPYPCVVETGKDDDTIIVDIIEPSDSYSESLIDGMERGAGYSTSKVNIDGEDCKIYVFKEPSGELIESGDWMDYKYSGRGSIYKD